MNINANISIIDAGIRMNNLVFNVISLVFTKLSKFFLYSFV